MSQRPNLKRIIASQLPAFIREDYPTFVAFVEAYYEWLGNQKPDLYTVKDIDKTLENFIEYFKNELAVNFLNPPDEFARVRHDLAHIKDYHLAKGSEQAYKFLFRLMFGKSVTVEYPGKQILRASDGKWQQDVSIFAKVNAGHPDDVVGRLVDVVTPNRIIRVLVDRRQDVEVEVGRVVQISPNIYEFYIDRRFFGDISVGDRLRYAGIFDATILSTTSTVTVQQKGKGFKVGQLFEIRNGDGAGSVLKVKSVDSAGGILSAEFVKYGIGYSTNFTATLLAASGTQTTGGGQTSLNTQTITGGVTSIIINNGGSGYTTPPVIALTGGGFTHAAQIGTVTIVNGSITKIDLLDPGAGYTTLPEVNVVGDGVGASVSVSLGQVNTYSINETTEGFSEQGVINRSDYAADTAAVWLPNTQYTVGTEVYWAENVYIVQNSGTTNSTPPTHTTGQINQGVNLLYSRKYGAAFDGTYAGEILREFFFDSTEDIIDPASPAIVSIKLGPLTKYPGYYKNNDGFLDDAIFIQDSRYYQAFSYVLKIDETLEKYKSVVKTLVHPAGLAMFGEYDIRNEFDLSIELESMVKILVTNLQDEVSLSAYIAYKDFGKYLSSPVGELLEERTNLISKPLGAQLLLDNVTLESTQVDVTDDGISAKFVSKALTDDFGFTEETTLAFDKLLGETDNVIPTDSISYFDIEKPLEEQINLTETFAADTNKYIEGDDFSMSDDGGYIAFEPYEEGNYFAEVFVGSRINF